MKYTYRCWSIHFFNLLDWFVPSDLADANDDQSSLRRYRLFVGLSFLKGILLLGMSIFILLFPRQIEKYDLFFMFFFFTMAIYALGLPFVFRRTGAYVRLVTFNLLTTRLLILALIFVTGGIISPNLVWLMMGPVVTMIFLGTHAAFFDMISVLICFTTFYALGEKYVLFLPDELVPLIHNTSAILATAALTFAVMFFESARVRAEERLKTTLHDLQETNSDLRLANQEAQAATKAKSDFLANMSHEIRTPLNTVIGMTGLMLDMPLSDQQREFTNMIRSSGDALLALINDILDFSKIEAGKFDLEEQSFNLHVCVEEAADIVSPKAIQKELEVIVDIHESVPLVVFGDETRLRQILINLMGNAIKFTPAGEVIVSVDTRSYAEDIGVLHFSVKDTGIGILPEAMPRLFQMFTQMDTSTTRRYGGTGLGLAISKQLVEMMGGEIWVESEVSFGSDFQFSLPIRSAQPDADVTSARTLAGKRLLIVENNRIHRQVLEHKATHWGMSVTTCSSGEDALAQFKEEADFDVIVTNLKLPGIDGLTLAEEIHTLAVASQPAVVLMAYFNVHRQDVPFEYVAARVNKPVKAAHLHDVLTQVLVNPRVNAEQSASVQKRPLDSKLGEHHPLRILIAEDNPMNQKVATYMLERLGYRADVAANGIEVLTALQRQPYDLVLMDVQMPEMDGYEATMQIRKMQSDHAQPYIVAVTANAMKGDREKCIEAGMKDYISKPIRMPELSAALSRCPSSSNLSTSSTPSMLS